jgi:hypothetical protein
MLLKIRDKLSQGLPRRRTGAALLACALLFATALDVGHQHDTRAGELQCYTCHFSPELAPGADTGSPAIAEGPATRLQASLPTSPLPAEAAPYAARGPPLLV